uniref:HET domain-containing protein n=1 Tax=Heterorhabditis bacteriophora TaxID=37862 RepID=A0A1I7WN63_HETBA
MRAMSHTLCYQKPMTRSVYKIQYTKEKTSEPVIYISHTKMSRTMYKIYSEDTYENRSYQCDYKENIEEATKAMGHVAHVLLGSLDVYNAIHSPDITSER